MNKEIITDTCDTTAQTKKNTLRLFFWSVAWVLATAGVAFGSKNLWNFNTWLTIIAVLIHIGLGLGMIRVFKQYLLGLDELQRKIQLDAMAKLSFGRHETLIPNHILTFAAVVLVGCTPSTTKPLNKFWFQGCSAI